MKNWKIFEELFYCAISSVGNTLPLKAGYPERIPGF